MNGYNDISDKELHALLKHRLLKGSDEDPLTQNLMDMEAKIVFGPGPQILPSPQGEAQFINRLKGSKAWPVWLRWLLPSLAVIAAAVMLIINNDEKPEAPRPLTAPPAAIPHDEKPAAHKSAQMPAGPRPVPVVKKKKTSGDPKIGETQVEPKEEPVRPSPGFTRSKLPRYDDEESANHYIPEITPKMAEENNKYKEKMIKQLIKKDSRQWVLIPMSTELIEGDTVTSGAYYISATEVSNKQYRTFLYDLLIQGRVDEYVIAAPDTMKWEQDGIPVNYYSASYHTSPAFDNYPAVNISRKGAEMYCHWLTEETYNYQKKERTVKRKSIKPMQDLINDVFIPSEEQWVKAARGGLKAAKYPWGGPNPHNSRGCYLANFNIKNPGTMTGRTSECASQTNSNAVTVAGMALGVNVFTAPVNSFNPNNYGTYNMSGNVAEMVWVISKTEEGLRPGTKGGSWMSDCERVRIDAEDEYAGITEGSPFIGFRPAVSFLVEKQ